MWAPAFFHLFGLAIALTVQFMASPLAGAWLLFSLAGCAYTYHPPKHKDVLWLACLAWLSTLGVQTFLLMPISGGAATMWVLAAMPLIGLSMSRKALKPCLVALLALLALFAAGLIAQMLLQVQYTNYNYHLEWRSAGAMSWPLVDPNNAACVLNFGFLPCIWKGLRDRRWLVLAALFAFALFATASKAGAGAAAVGVTLLLFERFWGGVHTGAVSLIAFFFGLFATFNIPVSVLSSFSARLPIWKASWPLFWALPYTGLGLGSFGAYYSQVRTEHETGGAFAHNDLLQLGIEMGIPALVVFCALLLTIVATTNRKNIASMALILATFLQAMVEFQFYVPPVSILMGFAVAYHRLTRCDNCNIMR